jgi:hypothetical protein
MIMDKETRAHLEAMEARMAARFELMGRMNDAQEAIIERVRACETAINLLTERVHGCESAVNALTELNRAGNTTMSLIVNLLGDMARRVTDLEKKD